MQKAIAGSIWFVTCLLCVSILSASVDPLPDPPAVKPERVDAKADCLGELQTTPPKPSEAAALVGDGAVLGWLTWQQILDADPGDLLVCLVRRASDPSPPTD